MVDHENMRTIIVKGLSAYLNCPVISSNQDAEPPAYPYLSYTVTTPTSENNGTYGEYEDGIARKGVTTIWSLTQMSDNDLQSVTLANKAKNWFEYAGRAYLNKNNVIVQSVTTVTNRDNVLTTGYEYRNGFDVTFWALDEVGNYVEDVGYIETAVVNGNEMIAPPTVDELNGQLEKRLTGEVS